MRFIDKYGIIYENSISHHYVYPMGSVLVSKHEYHIEGLIPYVSFLAIWNKEKFND